MQLSYRLRHATTPAATRPPTDSHPTATAPRVQPAPPHEGFALIELLAVTTDIKVAAGKFVFVEGAATIRALQLYLDGQPFPLNRTSFLLDNRKVN